ncbi:hypothetical protein [Nocardia sp. NPDC050710]
MVVIQQDFADACGQVDDEECVDVGGESAEAGSSARRVFPAA